MVYTVVAYSVSLKRQVRVVAVVWPGSRSSRTEVLNSTSITMTAATIIVLYRARFSMEFPFRDGKRPSVLMRSSVVNRAALTKTGAVLAKKQFAGLSECQSRQVEALHFYWNMALMAVSYGFRSIPVHPRQHRRHVHLPEHVLFPTPSSRIKPEHCAGFNRNPYEPVADRFVACGGTEELHLQNWSWSFGFEGRRHIEPECIIFGTNDGHAGVSSQDNTPNRIWPCPVRCSRALITLRAAHGPSLTTECGLRLATAFIPDPTRAPEKSSANQGLIRFC